MTRRVFTFLSTVLLLFSTFPCSAAPSKPIKVVTTTAMIAEVVKEVGGDLVEVTSLLGPGTDPHLFKPTYSHLALLNQADLIMYNGLHLEGKMGEALEGFKKKKEVRAYAEGVSPSNFRKVEGFEDTYDPHIWFDVKLWTECGKSVVNALSPFFPERREVFESRYEELKKRYLTLHDWVLSEISSIPEPQRVLITAHDAFGYFGRAYGIEVHGLQGISTASESGLTDAARLTDLVVQRKIKAVFVESSVSEQLITAVKEGARAQGQLVEVGGTLFSDAMGAPGTPEGTYEGMVKANVTTIVGALR